MNPHAVPEPIATELATLGIPLNSTLIQTIATAPPEVVTEAIAALKQALEHSTIARPGGWLKRAIEGRWQPNQAIAEPKRLFEQWFPLARQQCYVIASLQSENGELMVFDTDCVPHPFPQMLARYPLEHLQAQHTQSSEYL